MLQSMGLQRVRREQATEVKRSEVVVTVSCLTLCDPMDCSRQAPLSMGFSRHEYWSGLPSPGNLPNPEIKLRSPELQEDSLLSEPPGKQKESKVVPNNRINLQFMLKYL